MKKTIAISMIVGLGFSSETKVKKWLDKMKVIKVTP